MWIRLLMALGLAMASCSASAQAMPKFDMRVIPAPQHASEITLQAKPHAGANKEEWFLQDGGVRVRNVTHATLTPVLPAGRSSGAAVIVAPGGGFSSLSMESEGWDVARWLANNGIAAFVLKYRVLETLEGLTNYRQEMLKAVGGQPTSIPKVPDTPAFALDDAAAALQVVRTRSSEFGIDPKRVGFMGFSAGGALARSIGIVGGPEAPAFIAPIYPRMTAVAVPADAPPMFTVLAANDTLYGAEPFDLVESWRRAKRPVEFHFIETGGHGFGLGRAGTTSEGWIKGFYRWLNSHNFLKSE